ncbi:MAG: RNA polymerase sigma factor [Crocinitomicaceae bacterium]|nr:RNA polymerase sigma factor [Crocinitomicaceae bacterium]
MLMLLLRIKYPKESDERLMSFLIKGDSKAFNEIYSRYSGPLKGYFMRMLWRDEEKAEDFMHDLFAKIIRKPDAFDTNRSFKTWVYTIACNMCKNEYKKQEVRKNTSLGFDQHYNISDEKTNLIKEIEFNQFGEAFSEKLNELDAKHKEVFTLRHVEGLSIKEIAEIIQINEGTVKSRIFYATKQLAKLLKEYKTLTH